VAAGPLFTDLLPNERERSAANVRTAVQAQAAEGICVEAGTSSSTATSVVRGAPTVICAHRGSFDWRLGQLWRYRDLISLFVWRDFVSVYKQTILGPAWHILQPLLTALTFTVVFGRMAGLSTDGTPPFLFYMSGYVLWTYFSNSLDNTARTFVANAPLLGKVYFHRLAIPVSLVISNLIAFAIQVGILLVIMVAYACLGTPISMTRWALLTPIYLTLLAGYALGFGIIVCALTTRYRDLRHLISFGIQLLMYATPVIYPLSTVPARYRWIPAINPLTPVLEGFRRGFVGVGTVSAAHLGTSFALMLAVLTAGLMLFSRIERTFMDTV
jgi:lipopolysaccharide transport system permease protein